MDDLLREFLTETAENLALLDVELVRLERNPNDAELLGNIFRIVHTIKGTCGFLGLPRLEAVAHAAENVLGRIRDGELKVGAVAISVVLESLDVIKAILAQLEATEAEPPGNDADLIERLEAVATGKLTDAEPGHAPQPAAPAPAPVIEAPAPAAAVQATTPEPTKVEPPKPQAAPEPPVPARAEASVPAQPAAAAVPAAKPPQKSPDVPAPAMSRDEGDARMSENRDPAVAQQTIRVSVDLLENLMNMVSELVLTRNQLLQIVRRHKDSEFSVPLQRLSHVTSELQEGVMKTRMQPIGNAWAKLPRMIRDLSLELGKKIELQMIGAETELDRQVLELIKDPLTHMVRNSADHGIESPEQRQIFGKSETGRITLNAFHEGGHIIIQISDDGRGLDLGRIKQKALAQGLASESDLEVMSEQQIYQFIFKPGFSTASQVTAVSGRGVGMDVVRTNIEKIGGTIELASRVGRGSTFTIKIPLTLAIVEALIVASCAERFAIPQISVIELVRASGNSEHRIERINGTPVLRLRDRLLPLVSLEHLLQLDRAPGQGEESFIVVAQVGAYTFGILVDRVLDTEEIVVKPVAPILRHLTLFSGNTILGDGSVIMILDPNGVAAATGELTVSETTSASDHAASVDKRVDERTALLLFRAGAGGPKAVPLSLVARLEEIDLATVEYSHERPMVQYREKLMPLVPLDAGKKLDREGRQPILVFADGERSMGLVVDEIVDIVEDQIHIELSADRPGFLGSAIIAGQATDVIDTGHFLTLAFGDWFAPRRRQQAQARAKRVLLVDDSPFFRNLLAPLLSVSGYDVSTAGSAEEAMSLCESGALFDAIVTDIEMPGMNGFEFASAIRGTRWQETPVIALSSHTAPDDLDRGRSVGFVDYVAKFDRDTLLASLEQTISQRSLV